MSNALSLTREFDYGKAKNKEKYQPKNTEHPLGRVADAGCSARFET